jgi:hypothetical protein
MPALIECANAYARWARCAACSAPSSASTASRSRSDGECVEEQRTGNWLVALAAGQLRQERDHARFAALVAQLPVDAER